MVREYFKKKFNLGELEICDTFWKKFRGLMFSKPKNLLFILDKESKINSIVHMFFVFYPIDVYWFDKNKELIDKKRLMPFSVGIPKMRAKYILEFKT